jgi:hypothetical protein
MKFGSMDDLSLDVLFQRALGDLLGPDDAPENRENTRERQRTSLLFIDGDNGPAIVPERLLPHFMLEPLE